MKVIGLTGSIGMGKSTVAAMFAEQDAPFLDSDAVVHALYAPGGAAVAAVDAAFPGVARDGAIDRALLSMRVMNDAEALGRLERIVHPLVRQAQLDFLAARAAEGAAFVVLDVPLLLEGGNVQGLDAVVVVSAPADVQRARVLARPGMSPEKFDAILARQMPDSDKRARADFIIDTGVSLDETRAQVGAVLDALREQD